MSRLSKTASLEGHNSLTIRLVWWKTVLNILLDRYYGLGLGAGGFKYYIAENDSMPPSDNGIDDEIKEQLKTLGYL